jgi:hypothetical protein
MCCGISQTAYKNIYFFSLLSLFRKNRVGLWDYVAVCVYIPFIVARQPLGKNPLIIARQRLGKIPPSLLRNGSVKTYRGNEYTRNDRRIVGRVVFNVARVSSRKVGD